MKTRPKPADPEILTDQHDDDVVLGVLVHLAKPRPRVVEAGLAHHVVQEKESWKVMADEEGRGEGDERAGR